MGAGGTGGTGVPYIYIYMYIYIYIYIYISVCVCVFFFRICIDIHAHTNICLQHLGDLIAGILHMDAHSDVARICYRAGSTLPSTVRRSMTPESLPLPCIASQTQLATPQGSKALKTACRKKGYTGGTTGRERCVAVHQGAWAASGCRGFPSML